MTNFLALAFGAGVATLVVTIYAAARWAITEWRNS